jgi:hypothetical protein
LGFDRDAEAGPRADLPGREIGSAREGAVDDRPRSAYEMVTRQMLLELKENVAEVKGRVNTLLWVVIGAIVVELLMRFIRG